MRAPLLLTWVVSILLVPGLAGCGQDAELGPATRPAPPPEIKTARAGKNVTLEIQGDRRRVLVEAQVCLREGPLEQLLTRKGTKEHEAILAADVDARDVHKALLATGAMAGSPVKFGARYEPASGTTIKVTLQWEEDGKLRSVPAQDWIMNAATKKTLKENWVFAGSRLVPDPLKERPDYYLANDGDLICVANFESALMDLPVASPKDDTNRMFIANTERIPPRETRVVVIFEPIPKP